MHSFVVNISKLFLGRALSTLSSIVLMAIISRHSGPAGFGAFATVLTTAVFCSSICKFGLEKVTVAEAPHVRSDWTHTMALASRILPIFAVGVVCSMLTLITFGYSNAFKVYFAPNRIIVLVGIFVIFYSYQFILGEFFRAKGSFLYASLSKGGISNSAMLIIVSSAAFTQGDLNLDGANLWLLMAISAAIGSTILTAVYLLGDWKPEETPPNIKESSLLWKSSVSFLITSMIIFLLGQSDIWIAAGIFGAENTGYYTAASKLVFLTAFMISLINGVFAPKLASLARQESLHRFEDLLRAVSFINAGIGLTIATVLALFSDEVLLIVFGDGFEKSSNLLLILLLGQLASILVGPAGYALVVLHRGKALVSSSAIGLTTAVFLVACFSALGLTPIQLALSFALGNIALQLSMFVALKRIGISAFPSIETFGAMIRD